MLRGVGLAQGWAWGVCRIFRRASASHGATCASSQSLPLSTSLQKSSLPSPFAASQYTQTPWRCFAVDAGSALPGPDGVPERGDHFYVGQHDNAAITWVQGLQSLLHASGQLAQPLPPAKLLWLRARMRLLQRAVRHKSHAGATLAAVVQSAMRKTQTSRRG